MFYLLLKQTAMKILISEAIRACQTNNAYPWYEIPIYDDTGFPRIKHIHSQEYGPIRVLVMQHIPACRREYPKKGKYSPLGPFSTINS